MACSRGAASPNAHTQRRLFAASAGYCQNPGCSKELFIETPEGSIHIAEMAHVFAANDGGPRGNPELSEEERGSFNNLIMLCANCHTMVDKAPESYSDDIMLQWKRSHEEKLLTLFGARSFSERSQARQAIEPILEENSAIFSDFGPHIALADNPESGAAEKWKRKVICRILPNNKKIMAIIDLNRHLLSDEERVTLERFRQHVDDLEAFHIAGVREDASQFPASMKNILIGRL
ncbi:MAG: hypothetical protein P1U64_07330 [Alcanivoracaceae bacterium]|nr:hypothetical protein [Alcanivoracaceae bacterium]